LRAEPSRIGLIYIITSVVTSDSGEIIKGLEGREAGRHDKGKKVSIIGEMRRSEVVGSRAVGQKPGLKTQPPGRIGRESGDANRLATVPVSINISNSTSLCSVPLSFLFLIWEFREDPKFWDSRLRFWRISSDTAKALCALVAGGTLSTVLFCPVPGSSAEGF
jgi:hypothetical protein